MADYTARSTVILNGKQAEDQLEKLGKRATELREEMKKLRQANDKAGFDKKEQELKQVNKEMGQMRKEVFSVENVLKNLSSASFKEISTAARKANNEFKAMKQTDPGYKEKAAQAKLLNDKLREMGQITRSQQSTLSRLGEGFNKYFGIITAGAASFAGLILGMRKAVDTFNEFEERLDNLSALTGLTGDELKWLGDKADEFSTSVFEGGIRITQSSEDIVDAFTKMGSARPELLKDKEALAEVTKNALILAEAAKMEAEPAIAAVAAAMNQFDLAADQSTRIINAFAAGSLAGSAEVDDLTESFANVGTVADDSNLSLEQTVALLEVLGEKQLKGAEAGTMMRSALLKMKDAQIGYQTGTFNLRDALVEANAKLNSFSTDLEKDAYKQEIFGERSIVVGTILLNNVEKYDELTKAVTGTNTALEQAATNTDNNTSRLKQARNERQIAIKDLGEKLAPAMTMVVSKGAIMLKLLTTIVDIFTKYGPIIVTTTAAIAGYTVAVKLATLWEERKNKATLASIISQKLQALAFRAQFAAIALYNSVVALMTGNLKVAAIQFRAFSAALMANPAGIIAGAIVALGASLYMLSKRMTDTEKAQKALNDINLEANKNIVEERLEVERLMKVAQNHLQSKQDRLAAIKKLNEISPQYLGNLTLENINTEAATESTKKYTAAILENAKVQAAKEKLVEIEKKILDMQSGELSFMEEAQAAGLAYALGLKLQTTAAEDLAEVDKYRAEQIKALTLQKEKLAEITEKQIGLDKQTPAIPLAGVNDLMPKKAPYVSPGKPSPNRPQSPIDTTAANSLIAAQETLLEQAKALPETTETEIVAKNKKIAAIETEIARLKELGVLKNKEKPKSEKETALATNETDNTKAQNEIKKQLLDKLISEEQANDALLAAEIEFLEKKKALQIKYGDDFQSTEGSIIDKKLQAAKDADKKSDDEKKKAHTKILKDLANNEAAELNVIKKQLADKAITEEQAQQDLLLKEIEFLNLRIALKKQWGEDTAELEGKVLDVTNKIAENALKGDEARLKQLYDLRRDFEDEEVAKAQEKTAALAELDSLYKAGMLNSEEEYQRLKTKIAEKYEGSRLEKTKAHLGAINDILGGAAEFFGNLKDAELAKAGDNEQKREEIEKKFAQKQKTLAIGQAIISGAQAVLQLWAQPSVIPEPANSIYKGVMTAVIGATTIAQIAKIKSAKFAEGKYPDLQTRDTLHTGMYGDKPQMAIFNEVPGQPEMVIDGITNRKISLNYPEIQKAIYAVRDGRKPAAFANGKYPSPIPVSPPSSPKEGAGGGSYADPLILKKFDELADVISKLKIYTAIEDIKTGEKNYTNIQNTRGL